MNTLIPSFRSAKDPDETRTLTISFSGNNRLAPNETIVSAVWLVEQEDGTAVTSSDFLVDTCDVTEQPKVKQSVKGGVDGTTYLHRAKATTSTGRVICGGGYLHIVKGA
jgi:hypothetical protein